MNLTAQNILELPTRLSQEGNKHVHRGHLLRESVLLSCRVRKSRPPFVSLHYPRLHQKILSSQLQFPKLLLFDEEASHVLLAVG